MVIVAVLGCVDRGHCSRGNAEHPGERARLLAKEHAGDGRRHGAEEHRDEAQPRNAPNAFARDAERCPA